MNTQQRFDAGRSFDAAQYQQNASFVPALGDVILGWLAPQPGEHILDLGAGDGVLTAKLVAAGARVVAGDASPSMVAAATARGLDGRLIDGEALDFDRAFDAVFSSAALHWMPDAARVSAGVFRALRPGGRFVAEAGGFGCVAAVRVALADAMERAGVDATGAHPWYFPTAEHLRKFALIRCGYSDQRQIVCASKAEAQRVAGFVRPMDEYAVVTTSEAVVSVFTAQSQSRKAMGHRPFQESKNKVLDYIAGLLGVNRAEVPEARAA